MKLYIFALCALNLSGLLVHDCHAVQSSENITPANVYHKAQTVSDNLRAISLEMGIVPANRPAIAVTNVSPREVYFQATTLYQKSSQLMFEFTGKEALSISQLKVDARPSDVIPLLISVNEHLSEVLLSIGAKPEISDLSLDVTKTPTDVFKTIVDLNRTINNLLEFRFSPANVHQKITEGIAIASAILQTWPEATPVFYPAPRKSRKRPGDVYRKITHMYDKMIPVMAHFGKSCLSLQESEKNRTDIEPSDVYDLAVMMVSQLRYMHTFIPDSPPAQNSYYPGKVLPSDVYQRLSILELQMMELVRVNNIPIPDTVE